MRRDRFIEIARIMHCGNNNDMNHDKLFKLRHLMNKLKNKFIEHFVPSEFLNYDESMIIIC